MTDIRKRIGKKGATYQVRYSSKSTKTGYAYKTFDTIKEARAFLESGDALKVGATLIRVSLKRTRCGRSSTKRRRPIVMTVPMKARAKTAVVRARAGSSARRKRATGAAADAAMA